MNYKKKYLKYKNKYLKLKKIYGGSEIEDIDMEDIEVTEEYLRDLQDAYNKLRIENNKLKLDYELLENGYKAQESALEICFDSLKNIVNI